MALFTMSLEFRGGSYVSQVRAASPYKALQRWAEHLDPDSVAFMGRKTKKALLQRVATPVLKPQRLDGLCNAWRFAEDINGHLVWILIIRTET